MEIENERILNVKNVNFDQGSLGNYPFQNVDQELIIYREHADKTSMYVVICKLPHMTRENRNNVLVAIYKRLRNTQKNGETTIDFSNIDPALQGREFTKEGYELLFGGKLPYTDGKLLRTVRCPMSPDGYFEKGIARVGSSLDDTKLFYTTFELFNEPCLETDEIPFIEPSGNTPFVAREAVEAYIGMNQDKVIQSFQIKLGELYTPRMLTEYVYQVLGKQKTAQRYIAR